MFKTQDLKELRRLLKENNIAYIGIADGLRDRYGVGLNEATIRNYFPMVFDDHEKVHGNLKIYRVKTSSQ
jgi:hypothetical protein